MDSSINYKPSRKQLLFHQIKDKQIKVLLCGVGFGKTTALVMDLFKKMYHDFPGQTGMIVAPTYNLLRQGAFQLWQNLIPKKFWSYNSILGEMKLSNGSKIFWRTTSDPDKLRAISCVYIAYDEASADPNNKAFQELIGRARNINKNIQTQIAITTTPNGYNWLPEEISDGPGIHQGKTFYGNDELWFSENIAVIRAATYDNPYFPRDSQYVKQLMQNPRKWTDQNVEAFFVSKDGVIFTEFNDANQVDLKHYQGNFRRFYAAFDFGFTAPSCLSIIGRTDENKFVVVEEVYKSGITWDQGGWFEIFEAMRKKYDFSFIVCDSAHPERIKASNIYFKNMKFIPSDKDMDESIQRMNSMFMDKKLLVGKNCLNTIKELQNWSWVKSNKGDLKDVPEGKNDHSIDPIRYLLMHFSIRELAYTSFY